MWQARLASTPPVHHANRHPGRSADHGAGRDREVRAGQGSASTNATQASTAASAVRPSSDDASWPWKNPRQNSSSPGTESAIESKSAIPEREPALLAVHLERVPPERAPPRHDHHRDARGHVEEHAQTEPDRERNPPGRHVGRPRASDRTISATTPIVASTGVIRGPHVPPAGDERPGDDLRDEPRGP